MAKNLTAAAVEKLRRGPNRREVPDGGCPGLYLTIHTTGAKGWAFRYRRPSDGRPARLVLGTAAWSRGGVEPEPVVGGHLTLASARRLAARLRHDLAQGTDPSIAHLARKRGSSADTDTFARAAEDFILQHAMRETRRWEETAAVIGYRLADDGKLAPIRGGIADRWRARRVADVTEDDIFRIVDQARERAVPGLAPRRAGPSESRARMVHSALSSMFGWLQKRRRLKANPVAGLARPEPSKARDRVLSDDEVRAFWRAADGVGEPFTSALKLMLITGQRRKEVAAMRWSELSANLTTWTLPPERTKNRRSHEVPLSELARDLVRGAAASARFGDLVFTTTGTTPISGWSKIKRKIDALMGEVPDWRLHDLRRTTVTGMARAGADLHVIERAVNHASGTFGGIVGTYQRHKFEAEVRAALEAWSHLLIAIVEGRPDNVVPMRQESTP
jgi:integrase